MPREKVQDIDLDRFRINHNEPSLAGDRTETIGYGMDGLVMNDPDVPACLAKWVKQLATGTTRYFVKFSNVGPTAGTMVDPAEETDMVRRGDWTASGRFSFRSVTRLAFDLYVNFLKTGNRAYLHQAGREVTL
jgi:hypothetical protein